MGTGTSFRTRALLAGDPSECTAIATSSVCELSSQTANGCVLPTWDMVYAQADYMAAFQADATVTSRIFTLSDGSVTCPITTATLLETGAAEFRNGTWSTGPPRDCSYTEYGPWSSCTGACYQGGGFRVRTRSIAAPSSNGGAPCEESQLSQTEACNTTVSFSRADAQACASTGYIGTDRTFETADQAYAFGVEWCRSLTECEAFVASQTGPNAWHFEAGKGRTSCTSAGSNVLSGFKDCGASKDCSLTDWEPATSCGDCGPPFDQTFVRKIVHPATGGGKPCSDFPVVESRPCNVPACSVTTSTCLYGSWPQTKTLTAQEAETETAFDPYQQFFESLPLAAQVSWLRSDVGAGDAGRFMGATALPKGLAAVLNSGIGPSVGSVCQAVGTESAYSHAATFSKGSMSRIPNWYCNIPFYSSSQNITEQQAAAACAADPNCSAVAFNTGDGAANFTSVSYADAVLAGRCEVDFQQHDWLVKGSGAIGLGGWWPAKATVTIVPNYYCNHGGQTLSSSGTASSAEEAAQICANDPSCMQAAFNEGTGGLETFTYPFAEAEAQGFCEPDPNQHVLIVKTTADVNADCQPFAPTSQGASLWATT